MNRLYMGLFFFQMATIRNKIIHFTTSVSRKFYRHAPNVFTILSIVGVGTTIYLMARSTSDISKSISDIKNSDEPEEIKDATMDLIRNTAPVFISGTVTVGSIIASNRLSAQKINTLASAYRRLRNNYTDYKMATISVLGVDGVKEINKFLDKKTFVDHKKRLMPGTENDGGSIFIDRFTNETFRSTRADVVASIYALNRAFSMRGYVSLDEYGDLLGIPIPDEFRHYGWDYDTITNLFGTSWIDFVVEPCDDSEGGTYYAIMMLVEPELDGYETYDWRINGYNEFTGSYLKDDRDAVVGKINIPFDAD